MCARRRVDGMSRPATDTLIPTPAQYSGLPKRTSLGTNSASAAENFMAVSLVWLRGAVKATADAAIATKTAAGLLIFENMIDARDCCDGDSF